MKNKYILILLLVGIVMKIIGSMFKIMHWPGAGPFILIATALEVVSIVLLLWKILTTDKFNEFLNS